jgi:hypothetical protein
MLLSAVALLLTLAGQAPPPSPTPPPKPAQGPPKLYNETADARAQIDGALKAAAEDETIRTKLSNEYRYLRVDVGRLDKNVDLAATYGVRLSPGALPHLTVLDKQGKVLAQQPAQQLAASPGAPTAYDPDKIAAFLRQHQVAPVAADPLLASALAEAKRDGKYVFLWFSAPW